MQINKKVISCLLGGGIALTVASFGGIELSNKISYDKKIAHYAKISNAFNERSKEIMDEEGWYLPKWQNDAIWKKFHDAKFTEKPEDRKKFLEKYPTANDFRDYCFEFFRTKLHWCGPSREECSECTRKSSWDQ